jgi:predicted negative regulator of RcsB-dependent stress response
MQPASTKGGSEKRKIGEILSHYIHQARYALWTVLILAVVFLVGYFVWTEVNNRLASESTSAVEAMAEVFSNWQSETNAEKKAALEKNLMDGLDRLVSRYPRQYGAQRALFIRAEVSYANKAWEKAASDYQEVARRFPHGYLASIALYDAAVCVEQQGNADAAQALYIMVADSYKDSALAPRALFDAARLDEGKGAYDEAGKKYGQIGSDFPSSTWDTLAKNRMIALTAEGKIKPAGQ